MIECEFSNKTMLSCWLTWSRFTQGIIGDNNKTGFQQYATADAHTIAMVRQRNLVLVRF